jgi:hypothetical protein
MGFSTTFVTHRHFQKVLETGNVAINIRYISELPDLKSIYLLILDGYFLLLH